MKPPLTFSNGREIKSGDRFRLDMPGRPKTVFKIIHLAAGPERAPATLPYLEPGRVLEILPAVLHIEDDPLLSKTAKDSAPPK